MHPSPLSTTNRLLCKQASNTDAQWLEQKLDAAKIVNNTYVPEGYMPEMPTEEAEALHEDTSAPRTAPPPAQPQASAPPPVPKTTPPPEPPAAPPSTGPPPSVPGGGVAMRFLVPSQAKAPPKLPPS